MNDRTMKFGVRYIGASDRGFARFVSYSDAREFAEISTNANTEVIDLITGEVVK